MYTKNILLIICFFISFFFVRKEILIINEEFLLIGCFLIFFFSSVVNVKTIIFNALNEKAVEIQQAYFARVQFLLNSDSLIRHVFTGFSQLVWFLVILFEKSSLSLAHVTTVLTTEYCNEVKKLISQQLLFIWKDELKILRCYFLNTLYRSYLGQLKLLSRFSVRNASSRSFLLKLTKGFLDHL